MTDPEQDEAFETYLKRRSVLPNAASDERLEPPAALDAIVLKKAREAIKTPAAPDQGKQQMQRAPRWAVPVALAATLMLCLSVVMNISLNTNRPTANLQRAPAARADGSISGDRRESAPGDIPSHEIVLPEAKVAGSPVPHAPVVIAEQALRAPAATRAPMAPAPSAAPLPSMAAGASTGVRGALQSAKARARAADANGTQVAAAEGARAADSDGSQAAAAGGPRHPADPKAWLRQIDALRAEGKNEVADAEMRRFRTAFPGYAAKPAPPASSEPPK